MNLDLETFGLLQSEEIMAQLGSRDTIRAYADPAVAVNREVVRRMKLSMRFRDRTGNLRRGFSARKTAQRYLRVRGDRTATRLSSVFSRSPIINVLEGGTQERRQRRGRRTGRISARRIVETAARSVEPEVQTIYREYLNSPRGLERTVQRAAARKPRRDPRTR